MNTQEQINQQAVVVIPLQEWTETKALVQSTLNTLKILTRGEQKELLTPKEVCALLKIGRTTFDRYVRNGTLETVRINKVKYSKVYVKRSEVERHLGLLD